MHLNTLPFDQYQRYRFTRDIVEIYSDIKNLSKPLRILDVGGLSFDYDDNPWLPAREFFSGNDVIVVDTASLDIKDYIMGDGTKLDFESATFDVVIANDVLEHVPLSMRSKFIEELTRVTKGILIMSVPFNSAINLIADRVHYEFILKYLKHDHIMQGEHLINPLPQLNEIIDLLKKKNFSLASFGIGNTYNWLLYNFIKEMLASSSEFQPMAIWVDQYINENLYENEVCVDPPYRHVVVISKDDPQVIGKIEEQVKLKFSPKPNFNHSPLFLLSTVQQLLELKRDNDKLFDLVLCNELAEMASVPLKSGDEVSQSFQMISSNIAKIAFLIGTHGKRQHGLLKIEISRDNYVIFNIEVPTYYLKDNEWYEVTFPPQTNTLNSKFEIKWYYYGKGEPGISIWGNRIGVLPFVKRNGNIEEWSACLKVYSRNFSMSEKYQKELMCLRKEMELKNQNIKELEFIVKQNNQALETIIEQLNHIMEKQEKRSSTDLLEIIPQKDRLIKELQDQILAMKNTKGWRLLEKYRKIRNFTKQIPKGLLKKVFYKVKERGICETVQIVKEKIRQSYSNVDYDSWFRTQIPTQEKIREMMQEIDLFQRKPVISIVMPTYNTKEQWLRKAIESVQNQIYPFWELCICDDNSSQEHVWKILQEYAKQDKRIKITRLFENKGISGATNEAINLATGEYIGFLDHDDELTIDALYEVVNVINQKDVDLIYSDEDKLSLDETFIEPFFKPDWSPDYILSTNYICHFAVYRKTLGDEIGWLRSGFDGAQDYDLVLRFSEKTSKIHHIPKVLYHWRKIPGSTAERFDSKSYAKDAGLRALKDMLIRRGINGSVINAEIPGHYRVIREITEMPLVSIIIPTKDKVDLLKNCIESIKTKTDYPNYEIIIVDNGSTEKRTLDYLDSLQNETVLKYPGPFNYSKINNYAVQHAKGDYVLFLNNDTEVIEKKWLTAMLEHAQRREVGAVGAKLLYTDGRIQHAGVILGIGGVANHAFLGYERYADGYFGMLKDIRNYAAVTAACMLMRKEVFFECGGFNEENLAVAFNDVDLCLKLVSKGYLCVWTPYALLYHHESASRERIVDPDEVQYMLKTWKNWLENDPYYNPNLSKDINRMFLLKEKI